MQRTRTILAISLTTGYLIGSGTGRSAYEKGVTATRGLIDDLGVQSLAGAWSGRASEKLADLRHRFNLS